MLFFCLLTVCGGSIGHLVVALPTWGFATRIHAPLALVAKHFSDRWRALLGVLWLPALVLTGIYWLPVMELGIFGFFPGVSDPDVILAIVFVFLFVTTAMQSLAFLAAMVKDCRERTLAK